jgi:hypothetical protein
VIMFLLNHARQHGYDKFIVMLIRTIRTVQTLDIICIEC